MGIRDFLQRHLIRTFPPKPVNDLDIYWARPSNDASFQDLPPKAVGFIYKYSKCPYCHSDLYEGPRGGASVNLFCSNVDNCNSRFNVVTPEFGPIPWGQFTGGVPESFKKQIYRDRLNDHAM